ncbi:alanine:cation symporter family protein [Brachybacterium muris]|uniref:alanine/glycine:cation symporter family protein n=3 Tax=Brachybacterium muris TaxID=219301 RepID=UPI00223B3CA6|nr:alanine:cation symporter family protein [Brachybacterium muris]
MLWLAIGALFMTVWLRFQPISGFRASMQVIRGKFSARADPGEVSSFQALATELSGTVGLGNIAGVAVAVSPGGPGAALWIAAFGVLGMSMKMAEATLGSKFREIREDGSIQGGPMVYLRDGLASIGYRRLGVVLGSAYAVFTVLGAFGADLFQTNQVAAIVADSSGSEFLQGNTWLLGAVIAALVGIAIFGGVTSIARWTSRIMPAMAIVYMLCVFAVIVVNLDNVPAALGAMVEGVFTGEGIAGGVVGVAIVGIQRALFSNGAGVGTAGMAHSASKTKHPATEGLTAMWEPLIDSVVVCMLTAIAIVVTGKHLAGSGENTEGVQLTASAFSTVADWFPLLLTLAVALFGYSTLLAYAYYGEQALTYLFGYKKSIIYTFRVLGIVGAVIGSAASLDAVIAFGDASFFLMAVPNILGIYFLAKVVRLEIFGFNRRLCAGSIEAVEDEDLRVGLVSEDPTPEQTQRAEKEERAEKERLRTLHRTLSDDPDFPVRAAHHGDDLASPMGTPDEPIPDTGQFLAVEERRSEGDGGAGSGPAGGGSHRAD